MALFMCTRKYMWVSWNTHMHALARSMIAIPSIFMLIYESHECQGQTSDTWYSVCMSIASLGCFISWVYDSMTQEANVCKSGYFVLTSHLLLTYKTHIVFTF
jgi:hypothetical protein